MPETIDIDLWCGRWPFGRHASCTIASLVRMAGKAGISKGFISSFSSLFEEEDLVPNMVFAQKMRPRAEHFTPALTVDPAGAAWEEVLRAAVSSGFPLKVISRFRGGSICGRRSRAFLLKAQECRVPVIVQLRLYDERTAPFMLREFREADMPGLVRTAGEFPGTDFVVSCPLGGEAVFLLKENPGNIYVTTSFLEGEGLLEELFDEYYHRIIFGSNFPLFSMEAAVSKLSYCGADDRKRAHIASENAMRVFPPSYF